MTTPPSARTNRPSFDLRRATSALLVLSGTLTLGLTASWLGSGAGAGATTPVSADDPGWTAPTDDGWTQAAPDGAYSAQPQGSPRSTTRGS